MILFSATINGETINVIEIVHSLGRYYAVTYAGAEWEGKNCHETKEEAFDEWWAVCTIS